MQRSACFSGTRLDRLAKLVKSRSLYGVGFAPETLAAGGGAPVQYVRGDTADERSWKEAVAARQRRSVRPEDAFWQRTPFVDFNVNNAWEEEWRVPGGFRFSTDQVAFVFIPEALHQAARDFFLSHQEDHTGPAYYIPSISIQGGIGGGTEEALKGNRGAPDRTP